jgi:tetratricopeptide (TPR) repeat protein
MTNKFMTLTLLMCLSGTAMAQTRAVSAHSYLTRGDAAYRQGEFRRARADYELAIAFDGQAAESWNKLALAREQCGDLTGALHALQQALALAPRSANYLNNRARLYLLQGEISLALADLNLAITLAPKAADAYAHRGLAHAAQDDVTAALADFDTALRLNGKLVNTRFNRGLALLRLNRQPEAMHEFAEFQKRGGRFTPQQREMLAAYQQ